MLNKYPKSPTYILIPFWRSVWKSEHIGSWNIYQNNYLLPEQHYCSCSYAPQWMDSACSKVPKELSMTQTFLIQRSIIQEANVNIVCQWYFWVYLATMKMLHSYEPGPIFSSIDFQSQTFFILFQYLLYYIYDLWLILILYKSH